MTAAWSTEYSNVRTECPSVMYNQVLKYKLNDLYYFIEAVHA